MTDHQNHVTLTGRISAAPETRVLPSGDKVVSFRLVVRRSAAARRRSKQVVDTIECSAWTAALRRSVSRLAPGTEVSVTGELRRRFSRGGAGVTSRVTVDVDACGRDLGGSLGHMTQATQTSPTTTGLGTSDDALSTVYDVAMLDLDGVVYLGADAVPGAADALTQARDRGLRLAYITNNASRPATDVSAKLRGMGMPGVTDEDVVTSAQAVAHLMADALAPGSRVLLIGGAGLRMPLEERGLQCVGSLDESPVAVVQGFHADLGWEQLAEASYAIQSGLPWYVSNTDLTIPTARGVAPGNGSLVQAVRNATGAEPIVAGKPERALFDETIARVGGTHHLMVGDRLDTDIDGAVNAGIDSLAVLTGISSLQDIVDAEVGHRPTFVSADLRGLGDVHEAVEVDGAAARCGAAAAEVHDGVIRVTAGGADETSTLRAVVALAWHVRDRSDVPVVLDGTLGA